MSLFVEQVDHLAVIRFTAWPKAASPCRHPAGLHLTMGCAWQASC